MKKILLATMLAGMLSTNLMAGFVVGKIHEISVRSDGTFWVSMIKADDSLTNKYRLGGSDDALKLMQAAALTAKSSDANVQLLWDSNIWTRVEFIAP